MKNFERDELIRYSRQLMLPEVGIEGQEKLKTARILVIGAGGLGCPILQYLTAAGVGTIGIVDFDKVELHNLHRQILYHTEDIGKLKAEVAAQKLQTQNPYVRFDVHPVMIHEENADDLISVYDLVIDGSDNFHTRYLVNDTCVKYNKPLVYGSIFKFEGQLAVFNYQGGKNLRDIYPEPPNPEDVPNCSEVGVIGVLPGVIGTLMANQVIRLITGSGKVSDDLTIFNLLQDTFTKLALV
ncbi:HesA/MoeB/ThiF family protein [Cytophagaceae bacterium DM2B3-1]|uniref:HesA/MoeB/ThiF family protein n=1 Tax=Xanthocytophaga flava TaxID=3048013 RepID=A0ABT7CVB2_9BACT|nr:HesA/MoeB/ThiF family protein [Xanthocytophaga flavus]MDJ1497704.1 HesA/MoeB/ThiF family protein [Xanthocytophaga flavus]